ncbi:metallophosphoesterase [Tsukamurella soli]|uniref:Metallophosphoesterase family protein n=1 Tax=Tsukamurella soli TaxID=644556 RepID=A0ABP8K949_9ACTN
MKHFIADLHLQHPKLAELRGFESTGAHDNALLEALWRIDPTTDELWVLGDICSGGIASMRHALELLGTLEIPMHLVTGNHDPVNPMNRNAHKYFGEFTAVFETVQQYARTLIGGRSVLMSHYPYQGAGDHVGDGAGFERFTQYRLPDLGEWLMHGHTHDTSRRSGRRSICVSAEAWGLRPASEVEITEEMHGSGAGRR